MIPRYLLLVFISILSATIALATVIPDQPPTRQQSRKRQASSLDDLPPEMLNLIYNKLDPKSLFISTGINRQTRQVARQNSRWQLYYVTHQFISATPFPLHNLARRIGTHWEKVFSVAVHMMLGRYLEGEPNSDVRNQQAIAVLCAIDNQGLTPIHVAAKAGNLPIFKTLLKMGVPFDLPAINGKKPLQMAMEARQADIIRYIQDIELLRDTLEDGCNATEFKRMLDSKDIPIQTRNRESFTLFHVIADNHNDQSECTQVLLDKGASLRLINTPNSAGITSLMLASSQNNLQIIRQLLDNGADISAVDRNGNSAIMHAVMQGNILAAEILVERGADLRANSLGGISLFHLAAFYEEIETIRWLADIIPDVINATNSFHQTPLHYAIAQESYDTASVLLELGVDFSVIDRQGMDAFDYAISVGNEPLAQLIADRIDRLLCPLRFTIQSGDLEALERLNDVDPLLSDCKDKFYQRSALSWSVINNKHEIFDRLISRVSQEHLRSVDRELRSSLHHAAANGNVRIITSLLDKGMIAVNTRDFSGATPLVLAVARRHLPAVQLLLDRGAITNVEFEIFGSKTTLLHMAAEIPIPYILKLLVDAGALPNSVDSNRQTPLHFAAMNNLMDNVFTLLDAGADPDFMDSVGSTPLSIAAEHGFREIESAMRQSQNNQ